MPVITVWCFSDNYKEEAQRKRKASEKDEAEAKKGKGSPAPATPVVVHPSMIEQIAKMTTAELKGFIEH